MSLRPLKTQISLGIYPVWSESSLCAQWVPKDPSFLHADSEDSDQTGQMPKLIWVFAECTLTLLVLSCHGSQGMHCRSECRTSFRKFTVRTRAIDLCIFLKIICLFICFRDGNKHRLLVSTIDRWNGGGVCYWRWGKRRGFKTIRRCSQTYWWC